MSTARTSRKAVPPGGEGVKILATNRKARHDYHVEETFEAGISLQGNEVKSIRQGQASLRDGYAAFEHALERVVAQERGARR